MKSVEIANFYNFEDGILKVFSPEKNENGIFYIDCEEYTKTMHFIYKVRLYFKDDGCMYIVNNISKDNKIKDFVKEILNGNVDRLLFEPVY
jgi:hypothetical protein